MVKGFPLECMHLICLGIAKRLLIECLQGDCKVRLSPHAITRISSHMLKMAKHIPKDFGRLPGALLGVKKWKTT